MNHLCDRFTLQNHAAQSLARIELPNTIEPFFLAAPFPVSAIRPSCTSQQLQFQALGARKVVGRFDAGRVSSDGGAMLLRELDLRTGIVNRFAACFTDHRASCRTEHSVEELVRQRAFGLCLGYEDVVDHDSLRDDALLAAAVGHADVLGERRRLKRDQGHPLAGKSTLNRLELAGTSATTDTRYKKIVARDADIERFFVEEFIDAHKHEPMDRIVLDIDPTDIQLHGKQEGRFFHGYYGQSSPSGLNVALVRRSG